MVYLKGLFTKALLSTTLTLLVINISQDVEAATTKIVYKKPIFSKLHTHKYRSYKLKPDYSKNSPMNTAASVSTSVSMRSIIDNTTPPNLSTTTPTLAQSLAPTALSMWEATTPMPTVAKQPEHQHFMDLSVFGVETNQEMPINAPTLERPFGEGDEMHNQHMLLNRLGETATSAELVREIAPVLNNTLDTPVPLYPNIQQQVLNVMTDNVVALPHTSTQEASSNNPVANDDIEELFPLPEPEALVASRSLSSRSTLTKSNKHTKSSAPKTTTTATTESNRAVPCTCGIFLASQIKRGTNQQPEGEPVIINELDRTFQCNSVGQKQCQTKCLETIVQHLPNSANILCATLNRDCRKERAYLFIKNCRHQWFNTNLAAGREYCCRNGQPYTCPLV